MSLNIGGYIIKDNISSGSFGSIYKCNSNDSKQTFAIKISDNLKYEASIYKQLLGLDNISNFIDFFKHKNICECLVLKLYNFNLKQYKEHYYYDDNYINMLSRIIKGVINGIKNIHQKGIVHRDIKPNNICLNENFEPFIIDFGMAKKIINKKEHIKIGTIHDIIGTLNYTSINSINKQQLSRRDDMESLFFVYMFNILTDEDYSNYISKDIISQKNLEYIYNFLNKSNYRTCIKYIRNMTFTQQPNYEYIYQLLIL